MISCVILSAGLSTRFGSPKALALIYQTPNIVYLVQKLLSSKLHELIIVLGADADKIELKVFKHTKVRVVYNNDYILGQLSSIQIGLKNVAIHSVGTMILPIDCPFVKISTIDRLVEQFIKDQPDILIPTYNGRKGHPPVLNQELTQDVLNLSADNSLAELLHAPHYNCQMLELLDPGITQTFNTFEELNQLLSENSNLS